MIINLYIMTRSVLVICFFILLLNEVFAKESTLSVQGFIGYSVVLQCHSGNVQLESITAHWRYNDFKNVYDIEDGKESTGDQDRVYRDRTEMFPAEYMKGNFSLKLRKLQNTDGGSYCCFIPNINKQQCTQLQIKEKPMGIQEKPGTNSGVESKAERIVSLLIPFFAVSILFCVRVVV
ncbi:myelin-oligodendrocyte glycoprotein isoform X2 [Megalobrama amblycephala]|uniref:myelin-oligodendrocyte glycoprotein isoform X2 n=1 Tax=Megalobrama amblycephala TaxID=75352 RepID=UPI002013FBA7|nr:myelin-oligodendrocyte glycoprotein isoform X2 [Megalobrama amblycephala]